MVKSPSVYYYVNPESATTIIVRHPLPVFLPLVIEEVLLEDHDSQSHSGDNERQHGQRKDQRPLHL